MRDSLSVPGSWADREISYLSRRPDGRREGAEPHGRNRVYLIFMVVDRLDVPVVVFGLLRLIERRLNPSRNDFLDLASATSYP